MPDDATQQLGVVQPPGQGMMIRREGVGGELRVFRFVVPAGGHAERERLDRLGNQRCHQPDDERRIQATGQERAQRDVAHQPDGHRFAQTVAEFDGPILLRALGLRRGVAQRPIARRARRTVGRFGHVPGKQLADAGKQRPIFRNVAERQVPVERLRIDLTDRIGNLQGLDLRGEKQAFAGFPVVQRLDPETIADQQEFPLGGVPQRDREHPAKAADKIDAVLEVQRRDDLAVGVRVERVTSTLEIRS